MKNTNRTNKNTNQTNILHKDLSYKVIGCVYDVRNTYGSGQKELVYQNALAEALEEKRIPFLREVNTVIRSHKTGKPLGNYRLDFLIDRKIIVEVKAMKFTPLQMERQLYSYLSSTRYEIGYLVNFGSSRLFIRRVILTNNRKQTFR